MKFEIKNRWNGKIVYSDEAKSFRALVESAVKSRANLYGANLSGVDLSGADLSRSDLPVANLSGVDLSGANLYGANLSRSDLPGANLSGANLYGADLSWADLSGANLSGADLSWANLSGANLYGANLYGYFSFGPGGSRNAYTWARWEQDGYMVHCGCQSLTLKDFAESVKKTHGKNDHAKFYSLNIKTMEHIAKMSEKAFREYERRIAAKAA